jgi:hypothetical protein
MKGFKFTLLALAFLLPISIFFFLRFFGKNQFDVEPLFQEPRTAPGIQGCDSVSYPYVIAEMKQLGVPLVDSLTVVHFSDDATVMKELARVEEEFRGSSFAIVPDNMLTPDSVLSRSKTCIFLMKPPVNTVLVDNRGRIRGQYDLTDLDEADRLIVEMKIILNQY